MVRYGKTWSKYTVQMYDVSKELKQCKKLHAYLSYLLLACMYASSQTQLLIWTLLRYFFLRNPTAHFALEELLVSILHCSDLDFLGVWLQLPSMLLLSNRILSFPGEVLPSPTPLTSQPPFLHLGACFLHWKLRPVR